MVHSPEDYHMAGWKMNHFLYMFKRRYIFKWLVFHFHVSFWGCMSLYILPGCFRGSGMSLMKYFEILIAPPDSKMEGKCLDGFVADVFFGSSKN